MPTDQTSDSNLAAAEYQITDPALLKNMRLSASIKEPGLEIILVNRYTPVTLELIQKLKKFNIKKIAAEPVVEQSIESSIVHMEETFSVIEGILGDAGGQVEDVTEALTNRQQMRTLENLIRDNLDDIEELFSSNATEKLVALTKHHNGTARHSLIAAFQLMAVGKELDWSENKIVKAAMALLNHDIGKAKVNLETLNWPGRLNSKQWKEIQFHPLFGSRMLYQPGHEPDLIMLSALLHHEWYATVEGKGYGGLTLYADFVKRAMKFDVKKLVEDMQHDDREIIQITCLADMISALEESRAYKRGLDAFKVMIIMNSDAKMGHFNPEHYRAWHRIYLRQNPNMLPLGRRMALPREKERRIFTTLPPKKIPPTPLLTYYEMEKLGYLSLLRNVGMDMERIRRRGGLSIKALKQISKDKSLDLDFSEATMKMCHIKLVKTNLIREQQVIELDAWREWISVKELEKTGLMGRAKSRHFDINLIHRNGGICPSRLRKRGIDISEAKLAKLGVKLLKELPVQLPGSENRLTHEDLRKLGITDVKLKNSGCLERVEKVKSGVPLDWLIKKGMPITGAMMAQNGIDPIRKIFYDIQVVKEVSSSKAIFRILREGDDPKELDAIKDESKLGPIQDLLLNQIGQVVMDFSDLLALPDLSHVTMGEHWGRSQNKS
jgi:HD-GYP domain-containing protein (c-di-GMP phosphodiesterase class II)